MRGRRWRAVGVVLAVAAACLWRASGPGPGRTADPVAAAALGLTPHEYDQLVTSVLRLEADGPRTPDVYGKLVYGRLRLRQFDNALRDFREGLCSGDPRVVHALAGVPMLADGLGEPAVGAEMAESLHARFPDEGTARGVLVHFLMNTRGETQRDPVRAARLLREARGPFRPQDARFELLVRALRAAGRQREASHECEARLRQAEAFYDGSADRSSQRLAFEREWVRRIKGGQNP